MKTSIASLRSRYRSSPWARALYDPVMGAYYWLYLAWRLLAALAEVPYTAWRFARLRRRQARWRAGGGDWFSYQGRIYWLRGDGSLEAID